MMVKYVTIRKFSELTGIPEDGVRSRIKRGDWIEGQVWRKKGGSIFINLRGYEAWVEDQACVQHLKTA